MCCIFYVVALYWYHCLLCCAVMYTWYTTVYSAVLYCVVYTTWYCLLFCAVLYCTNYFCLLFVLCCIVHEVYALIRTCWLRKIIFGFVFFSLSLRWPSAIENRKKGQEIDMTTTLLSSTQARANGPRVAIAPVSRASHGVFDLKKNCFFYWIHIFSPNQKKKKKQKMQPQHRDRGCVSKLTLYSGIFIRPSPIIFAQGI